MNLITIKTFNDAISAHILKNKLESEGVQCFIFDEETVTVDPLLNFAIGGVKLKINDFNRDRALVIINAIEETPFTDNADNAIRCPSCNSTQLYNDYKSMKDPKSFMASVISILIGAFPFYSKSVYKCKKCGEEFSNEKSKINK